jgi:hypothetical protein
LHSAGTYFCSFCNLDHAFSYGEWKSFLIFIHIPHNNYAVLWRHTPCFYFLYFIIPTFTAYFINILTTAILIILYIYCVYFSSHDSTTISSALLWAPWGWRS